MGCSSSVNTSPERALTNSLQPSNIENVTSTESRISTNSTNLRQSNEQSSLSRPTSNKSSQKTPAVDSNEGGNQKNIRSDDSHKETAVQPNSKSKSEGNDKVSLSGININNTASNTSILSTRSNTNQHNSTSGGYVSQGNTPHKSVVTIPSSASVSDNINNRNQSINSEPPSQPSQPPSINDGSLLKKENSLATVASNNGIDNSNHKSARNTPGTESALTPKSIYKLIKIGTIILGRDSFHSKYSGRLMYKWRESEIIDLDPNNPQRIFIHFLGWNSSFDVWIDIEEEIHKIAPVGLLTKPEMDAGVALDHSQLQLVKYYLLTGNCISPSTIPSANTSHSNIQSGISPRSEQQQLQQSFSSSNTNFQSPLPTTNRYNNNPSSSLADHRLSTGSMIVPPLSYDVGQSLDILDIFYRPGSDVPSSKWRKARIIDRHDNKIRISYIGWDAKFDETLDIHEHANRISAFGTTSTEQTSIAITTAQKTPPQTDNLYHKSISKFSFGFMRGNNNTSNQSNSNDNDKEKEENHDENEGENNGNASNPQSGNNTEDERDEGEEEETEELEDDAEDDGNNENGEDNKNKKMISKKIDGGQKSKTPRNKEDDAARKSKAKKKSSSSFGINKIGKMMSKAMSALSASSPGGNNNKPSNGKSRDGGVNNSNKAGVNRNNNNNNTANISKDLQREPTAEEIAAFEAEINKERVFIRTLQQLGYHVIEIEGDGNCLFRALSHQLYLNEEYHEKLRFFCCEHLKKHRLRFEKFIIDMKFEDYLEEMSKNGTWADDIEIRVMEEILDRNIHIYSSNSTNPKDYLNPVNETPEEEKLMTGVPPINLSYHGQSHYNSIYYDKTPLPLPLRHTKVLLNSRIALFEGKALPAPDGILPLNTAIANGSINSNPGSPNGNENPTPTTPSHYSKNISPVAAMGVAPDSGIIMSPGGNGNALPTNNNNNNNSGSYGHGIQSPNTSSTNIYNYRDATPPMKINHSAAEKENNSLNNLDNDIGPLQTYKSQKISAANISSYETERRRPSLEIKRPSSSSNPSGNLIAESKLNSAIYQGSGGGSIGSSKSNNSINNRVKNTSATSKDVPKNHNPVASEGGPTTTTASSSSSYSPNISVNYANVYADPANSTPLVITASKNKSANNSNRDLNKKNYQEAPDKNFSLRSESNGTTDINQLRSRFSNNNSIGIGNNGMMANTSNPRMIHP